MAWYDPISDLFTGVTDGVTDILDSEGVGKLVDAGSSYLQADLNSRAMDKAAAAERARRIAESDAAKANVAAWAVPVGIGLAGLLVIVLILSMFSRRR